MTDTITLTGLVATTPRVVTTAEGLHITSFRLASTQRRFDRARQSWVDGDTNWYTVSMFRKLAANAAVSLQKGDRVIVAGRLRLRDWEAGERKGINIDIEADVVGHDLAWGTAVFARNISATPVISGVAGDTDVSEGIEPAREARSSFGEQWVEPHVDAASPPPDSVARSEGGAIAGALAGIHPEFADTPF